MLDELKITLFLVDDDLMYLKALENEFKKNEHFEIHTFTTGEACLQKLSLKPDIIILDYFLNGDNKEAVDGFNILVKIKQKSPEIHVIMLSSYENVEIAVNCIKYEAFNFIVKNDTAFIRLKHTIKQIFRLHSKVKELIVWDW
ncbi:MAG: response regulator [Bacteroidota bacterium]|nr:response regulator [Bacteroidota bacterium]